MIPSLINSAQSALDVPSKLEHLRQLKDDLLHQDPVLLSQLLPRIIDLHTDSLSPVRKFIAQYAFVQPAIPFVYNFYFYFIFTSTPYVWF